MLFFFKLTSRRQAKKQLGSQIFFGNMKEQVPNFKGMTHADALARLLAGLDPEKIQEYSIQWIKKLLRNKKFKTN